MIVCAIIVLTAVPLTIDRPVSYLNYVNVDHPGFSSALDEYSDKRTFQILRGGNFERLSAMTQPFDLGRGKREFGTDG